MWTVVGACSALVHNREARQVSTATKRITKREARELASQIKQDLSNLEGNLRMFHALHAWLPLGYASFLAFWDAELSGVPISMGLRNWVIAALVDEQSVLNEEHRPVLPRGSRQAIAEALGVSVSTVSSVRAYLMRDRYKVRRTGYNDDDKIGIGLRAPYRWHRHIHTLAVSKHVTMTDLFRKWITDGARRAGIDLEAEPWQG